MQSNSLSSVSPSFNSYSSDTLSDIAARVVEELKAESNSNGDDAFDFIEPAETSTTVDNDNDDEEFEFAVVHNEPDLYPICADEIFYNGQIRPTYPVFDQNLLISNSDSLNTDISTSGHNTTDTKSHIRVPLRKLFMEERETPSCSSSDVDELEGLPPGTYCVWTPKSAATETEEGNTPSISKKSNSTGTLSKKWRLSHLINHRSNSDGKDTFVFFTPLKKIEESTKAKVADGDSKKHVTRGNQRRLILPYKRQDMLGIFNTVNGLSRNLHPF